MPIQDKNTNNLENNLLLENGRIVNLKIFAFEERKKEKIRSPYVLNLKPAKENENKSIEQGYIPNLLNLKKQIFEPKYYYSPPATPSFSPKVFSSPEPESLALTVKTLFPAAKEKIRVWSPLPSFSWIRARKSLLTFMVICLFFSSLISGIAFFVRAFNLKRGVLERVNIAYAQLDRAQNFLGSEDYEQASLSFKKAGQNFTQAISDTQMLGKIATQALELLSFSHKISAGPKLLKIGEYIAGSGEYLARALKPLQNINPVYNSSGETPENNQDNKLTFTQAIGEAKDNLEIALLNIKRAENEIQKIESNNLDKDIQEKVDFLKQNIPFLRSNLESILSSTEDILEILGQKRAQRYLLLFQNNNEIRATGGFIGSYGFLDLDEGQIKKLEIDEIYNPDGQLLAKISPPPPIRFTNTRWQTRDANWFPDFPTSAQKIAWFLEKAGKPSPDGVIALTPQVMVELLKITGPIPMPEYGTTISADNFVVQTQKEVELEYDRTLNRPKKFLADLAPKVLNKMLSTEKPEWLSLLNIFSRMLEEKHLLFYFFDPNLQRFAENQGWAGEIKNASQDYLEVVNTNINGGKTDGMIEETINLESQINTDGSLVNTVEITRKHTGTNEWPSINNIDYLRLYVPKGSTLISASGFAKVNLPPLSYEEMQYEKDPLLSEILKTSKKDEASGTIITQEFGKTCFGNWVAVKPQEEVTVRFQYKLPFPIRPQILNNIEKYTLLVQKQAGSLGSQLNFRLLLPSNLKMIWQHPSEIKVDQGGTISWNTILNTDKYLGVALEKK